MKKTALIATTFLLVFILSGCGKENKEVTSSDKSKTVEESQNAKDNSSEAVAGKNEGSALDKLKNAITSGKKMKCTYKMKDEKGSLEVVTYMQGEKYKSEIVMGATKTVSVFDGEAMYSWTVGQKQGMKMTMQCMESLGDGNENKNMDKNINENVPKDEEEFVDSLGGAENLSCEDAGDVDFIIPSEVEFTDQCEMLKSQQKLMEGFGNYPK